MEISEGGQITLRERLQSQFPLNIFETPFGNAAVRDFIPTEPVREEDIPMITMVGWGMNQKNIGSAEAGLYALGQHTITLDIEGEGEGIESDDGNSPELNRQAEIVFEYIKSLPQEKVFLLGQSISSLVMIKMLDRHPEIKDKIAGFISMSGMGLGGKDNLAKLGGRQAVEAVRGMLPKNELGKVKYIDGIRRVLKGKTWNANLYENSTEKVIKDPANALPNNFYGMLGSHIKDNTDRAKEEILAMANADEYESLQRINDMGIPVGLIQGEEDMLNSSKRVWGRIGENAGTPWKKLGLRDYLADPKYRESKIRAGSKIWDKEYVSPTPPIDKILMVGGGHETYARDEMPKKIIRMANELQLING